MPSPTPGPAAPAGAPTVNVGILAHIDAGKTSLTERLLYDTGVTGRLGSVDAGTTRTDTLAIERRRGITVRAAVAALPTARGQVNLIDTPGHGEFVAEVERVLDVLDGAVLVVSATDGVQPQTRVLMRTLRRMRLPALIFCNKIDRPGARHHDLLAELRRRLSPHIIAMTGPRDAGTRAAAAPPYDPADREFAARLGEALADHDDALLARLVDGERPGADELTAALAAQTSAALIHPVYFGSAITGAGIPTLLDAMTRLLPRTTTPPPTAPTTAAAGGAGGGADEPVGSFFAVRRGPRGETVAYLRLRAGTLRPRARVGFWRPGPDGAPVRHTGRVTGLHVVTPTRPGGPQGGSGGAPPDTPEGARAGDIAEVRGLAVAVGARLGAPTGPTDDTWFAAPGVETVIRARDPRDTGRLHAALRALGDADPLIVTGDTEDDGVCLRLYGEVQKEVIAATLTADFGVDAVFTPSRPVYVERPAGTGAAAEAIGHRDPVRFWATVGLRVEPGARASGVTFARETELGALPRGFDRAIEATVRDTLRRGRYGWPVTDCRVTLTRSGYSSVFSTAGDFRAVTPLVLAAALERAGTRVYAPVHAFELEAPAGTVGAVTGRLAALGASVTDTAADARDPGTWLLRGELAARHVHTFQAELPGLARGEGAWWSHPAGDRPLPGRPPRRPNPGR